MTASDMTTRAMTTNDLRLDVMSEVHLDAALALSRAENWPHRREDLAFALSVSQGLVALRGEMVVGTAVATICDADHATVSTVIVDRALRGQGLGRRLLEAALALCGARETRLVATAEGRPLYEKLGFVASGVVAQHQRRLAPADAAALSAAGAQADWAAPADRDAILGLDRRALGLDRSAILSRLLDMGRVAVLREGGAVRGFGLLRPFGRGLLVGPASAESAAAAQAVIAFLLTHAADAFVRIDAADQALSGHLTALGLPCVDVCVAMRRGARSAVADRDCRVFALASQAFG